MKKIIFSLTLLLFVARCFSQTTSSPKLSKDYYLQKSKTQKTIGWVLLAGGTAMVVGGAISYPKRESSSFSEAYTFNANDIIILIGTGADIISIPFFISAHKNKKRAARVAITNQKILWSQKNNIGFVTQPSFTIKIGL
jgi:hypothetical protein